LGIGSGVWRKEGMIFAADFSGTVVFYGNKLDASSTATGEAGGAAITEEGRWRNNNRVQLWRKLAMKDQGDQFGWQKQGLEGRGGKNLRTDASN